MHQVLPRHTAGMYKSKSYSFLQVILCVLVIPDPLSQGFSITQFEWQR